MPSRTAPPVLLLLCACGRGAVPAPPTIPEPIPEPYEPRGEVIVPPSLPEVPPVDGPLMIRVVYPPAGSTIEDTDSAFAYGSVGTGRATLRLNGQPVRVWPNGSWLAWLALPTGTDAAFELEARRGPDSVRVTHRVRRVASYRPPVEGLWVDTTSFEPAGRVWWPAGEPLRLSVRATEGATVRLRLADGRIVPLGPTPAWAPVRDAMRGFDRDSANLLTRERRDLYTGAVVSGSIGAPLGPVAANVTNAVNGDAVLEVVRGRDTMRARWPLQLTRLDAPAPWVELDDDRPRKGDTDRLTVGRAVPGGTYHWFFPAGTRAPVSGRVNADVRLQIAATQHAWVSAAEVTELDVAAQPGPARLGSITAAAGNARASIRIPLDWRVPFQVEEREDGVTLTLYSAVGDPNWIRYGATGGILRDLAWKQARSDVVELTARLGQALWGFRTRWERNDLVLELRGPPASIRGRPLQGKLIVVDPGHPPAGSTGPSGLTEAEANLGVARVLERLLEEDGARVVLTRRSNTPLDLWPRIRLADSVDADLLVSIHNNALPDGVNPFTNNGSSVFYFHPRGVELARAIQKELLRHLPLPDLGIARGDLALVRGTWMPAVLVEGFFMILPEQEAALRSDAGRLAYATAVRAGIRAFLAGPGL